MWNRSSAAARRLGSVYSCQSERTLRNWSSSRSVGELNGGPALLRLPSRRGLGLQRTFGQQRSNAFPDHRIPAAHQRMQDQDALRADRMDADLDGRRRVTRQDPPHVVACAPGRRRASGRTDTRQSPRSTGAVAAARRSRGGATIFQTTRMNPTTTAEMPNRPTVRIRVIPLKPT